MLRLSSDIQAADPVEPAQGALCQDGGRKRDQGRELAKEFHAQRTQGDLLSRILGDWLDERLFVEFSETFDVAGKEAGLQRKTQRSCST